MTSRNPSGAGGDGDVRVPDDRHVLTWPRVIFAGFTLIGAVAAGTWAIRQDRIDELERRLEFFQEADKWNVPSLLLDLKAVSASIQDNLQKIRMYETALNKNAQLKDEMKQKDLRIEGLLRQVDQVKKSTQEDIAKLSAASDAQKAQLQARIDELNVVLSKKNEYIASLFRMDEQFVIEERNTRIVAGHDLALGVVDVSIDHVDIAFDNKEHRLRPGMYVQKSVGNDICTIYLAQIFWPGSPEKASFRLTCRDAPDAQIGAGRNDDSGVSIEKNPQAQEMQEQ